MMDTMEGLLKEMEFLRNAYSELLVKYNDLQNENDRLQKILDAYKTAS